MKKTTMKNVRRRSKHSYGKPAKTAHAEARFIEARPVEPSSRAPEAPVMERQPEQMERQPEQPVQFLMAGLSLVGAGMTALAMIPITATATLAAVPLLMGALLIPGKM